MDFDGWTRRCICLHLSAFLLRRCTGRGSKRSAPSRAAAGYRTALRVPFHTPDITRRFMPGAEGHAPGAICLIIPVTSVCCTLVRQAVPSFESHSRPRSGIQVPRPLVWIPAFAGMTSVFAQRFFVGGIMRFVILDSITCGQSSCALVSGSRCSEQLWLRRF